MAGKTKQGCGLAWEQFKPCPQGDLDHSLYHRVVSLEARGVSIFAALLISYWQLAGPCKMCSVLKKEATIGPRKTLE